MSLNKLTDLNIGHDLNLQIGCQALLSDGIICDTLSVGALAFPTTQLPPTSAVLTVNNSTLGYTVSPYAMLNFAVPYNLSPNILTEVAGGNTSQVIGSSSLITYGNDTMYDFKVTGALQGTQPVVNYYLVLGGVILNQISISKTIVALTEDYVEISGSMHIMAGFPFPTNLSTCMKVSYSQNYLSSRGIVTPDAPLIVSSVKQMGGVNLPANPKLSIQMMSPSGTVIFSNYLSSFNCSYAPMLILPS
jgi:hypothetical protein